MIYLHGRAQLVCQPNKHLLICTKCSSAQWKFQNHGLSYFESSFQFLYFISSIILLLIPLLLRGKALSERLQAKTCPFCGDMLYFTEAHDKWSPNLCVEFTDTNRNMIGAVMWMHWNVWAIGGGRLLIYTYKKKQFYTLVQWEFVFRSDHLVTPQKTGTVETEVFLAQNAMPKNAKRIGEGVM